MFHMISSQFMTSTLFQLLYVSRKKIVVLNSLLLQWVLFKAVINCVSLLRKTLNFMRHELRTSDNPGGFLSGNREDTSVQLIMLTLQAYCQHDDFTTFPMRVFCDLHGYGSPSSGSALYFSFFRCWWKSKLNVFTHFSLNDQALCCPNTLCYICNA